MFDHITLRVGDQPAATDAFTKVLDELDVEQTMSTAHVSAWGNFALVQAEDDHPIARRVHIAFIAPTPAHVERFAQAGSDAGFADDSPAGFISYEHNHYATSLKDGAGNRFEAVYCDGQRPKGNIDHVAIRVGDLVASTAFYSTVGAAASLAIRWQSADRTMFRVGASDGSLLVIAGEPTQNLHVAFSGDDDDVRRFHTEATAAGYRSNGEPGERPRYRVGYYAAFVLDPDGNNIEVVNHHRS
jgi:catechol 2,3-dioxygenase-like lactoylglutathione lyase family enzyme